MLGLMNLDSDAIEEFARSWEAMFDSEDYRGTAEVPRGGCDADRNAAGNRERPTGDRAVRDALEATTTVHGEWPWTS